MAQAMPHAPMPPVARLISQDVTFHARMLADNKTWLADQTIIITCSFTPGGFDVAPTGCIASLRGCRWREYTSRILGIFPSLVCSWHLDLCVCVAWCWENIVFRRGSVRNGFPIKTTTKKGRNPMFKRQPPIKVWISNWYIYRHPRSFKRQFTTLHMLLITIEIHWVPQSAIKVIHQPLSTIMVIS